jgi:hypothetical protein
MQQKWEICLFCFVNKTRQNNKKVSEYRIGFITEALQVGKPSKFTPIWRRKASLCGYILYATQGLDSIEKKIEKRTLQTNKKSLALWCYSIPFHHCKAIRPIRKKMNAFEKSAKVDFSTSSWNWVWCAFVESKYWVNISLQKVNLHV